jgi:hypothetical protein
MYPNWQSKGEIANQSNQLKWLVEAYINQRAKQREKKRRKN